VKLKTESGYQFTPKLEGRFTDVKTSRDTTHGFRAWLVGSSEASEGPLWLCKSSQQVDGQRDQDEVVGHFFFKI